MKKFKNSLNVRGSQSLLKAFIEEIEKLGYEQTKGNYTPETIESVVTYGIGVYNVFNKFYNGYGDDNVHIIDLPQDWNKALELAKEQEKQEPDLYTDEDLVYLDGKKEELFIGDTYYWVTKKDLCNNTSYGSSLIKEAVEDIKATGYWAIFKTEKAAQDYITLQKAIKESGLKVGDSFNQTNLRYLYTKSTCWENGGNFTNTKVKDFKTVDCVPCVLLYYTNPETLYAIKLSDVKSNKLTFGGNEVILNKKGNSVDITCKGVTGSYEELKNIETIVLRNKIMPKFGSVDFKGIEQNNTNYTANNVNVDDNTQINIGCSFGSLKEVQNILKECEKLLDK